MGLLGGTVRRSEGENMGEGRAHLPNLSLDISGTCGVSCSLWLQWVSLPGQPLLWAPPRLGGLLHSPPHKLLIAVLNIILLRCLAWILLS